MLKEFVPKYKEVELPLIGFNCEDSFENVVEISIDRDNDCKIYVDNDNYSFWNKSDLQEFINNLQKVCNNMKD